MPARSWFGHIAMHSVSSRPPQVAAWVILVQVAPGKVDNRPWSKVYVSLERGDGHPIAVLLERGHVHTIVVEQRLTSRHREQTRNGGRWQEQRSVDRM